MNFDKYITASPFDSGFDSWFEQVIENVSEQFYDAYEDWLLEYDGQANKWLCKLYEHEYLPKVAASILERALSIYRKPVKPVKLTRKPVK